MHRRFVVLVAALVLALQAPAAHAQPPAAGGAAAGAPQAPPPVEDLLALQMGQQGGLTADEAARRAVQSSLDVASKVEELKAAEAAANQTLYAFIPTLTLGYSYTQLNPIHMKPLFDPGALTQLVPNGPPAPRPIGFDLFSITENQSLDATLGVPVSEYVYRIPMLLSAAHANEESARLGQKATGLEVATSARSSYWTFVGARLSVTVAEVTLDNARSYLKDAHAQNQAGAISNADLLQAEFQAAQAEQGLRDAQSAASVSAERLAVAFADPPGTEYKIGDRLDTPVDVPLSDLATLYDQASRSRLDLAALRQSALSLHHVASAAWASAFPTLFGFGGVSRQDPNQRYLFFVDSTNRLAASQYETTWSAGAKLSWTPTAIPSVIAEVDQREAQARKLDVAARQLSDAIRLQISQDVQALQQAQTGVITGEKQLAAATEAYRVRRLLFQNGRATGTEVTQALSQLTTARLNDLSARIRERVAAAQLVHALGRDVQG